MAPLLPMLVAQTRAGVLGYLRVPAFSVTSLVLPIVFYTFFGLPNVHRQLAGGGSAGVYLLCSFAAYGVSSVMVFSFGIGVAMARGQKTDLLQRATPCPPAVAIAATVANACLFAVLSVLLLIAFAVLVGGVRLPVLVALEILGLLLVGSVPLIGLGMAIGYSVGPSAASAVANLVYLPLAFASGMFLPIGQLPDFVRRIAPALPTYHFAQMAYTPIDAAEEPLGRALLWTAVWSVVLLGLAVRSYRAEERRKFS